MKNIIAFFKKNTNFLNKKLNNKYQVRIVTVIFLIIETIRNQ